MDALSWGILAFLCWFYFIKFLMKIEKEKEKEKKKKEN